MNNILRNSKKVQFAKLSAAFIEDLKENITSKKDCSGSTRIYKTMCTPTAMPNHPYVLLMNAEPTLKRLQVDSSYLDHGTLTVNH